MPAVLGFNGFGARATARDRLTVLAGSPSYDSSNVPSDSPSTTSIGGPGVSFRAPWYDDENGAQFEPSTDELWFHARVYTGVNNTNNDTLVVGVARNGTEYISVSAEDSTNKLVIRVAGVVRATAASAALSTGTWERIHVHVEGASSGDDVHVYLDGDLSTPVVSYTLTGTDQTSLAGIGAPNEFLVTTKGGGSFDRVDDLVALDPAHGNFPGIQFFVSCGVAEQLFTGNGPEQDWTGSYTDIDERPASDADKIVATAVGNESSFTHAAIAEPNVFAAKVMARVTRTGTTAGQNLVIKLNDGTDDMSVTVPAPGDGDVQAIFERAPDGLAWSPPKYDATRFAFVSAT